MAKRDLTPPIPPIEPNEAEFLTCKQVGALLGLSAGTVAAVLRPLLKNRKIHRGIIWQLIQTGITLDKEQANKLGGRNRSNVHPTQKARILARDGEKCRYCGKRTTKINRRIDHILPWVLGGRNNDVNLVICCNPCNQAKGPLTVYQAKMKLLPCPNGDARLTSIQESLGWGIEKYQHYTGFGNDFWE